MAKRKAPKIPRNLQKEAADLKQRAEELAIRIRCQEIAQMIGGNMFRASPYMSSQIIPFAARLSFMLEPIIQYPDSKHHNPLYRENPNGPRTVAGS